MTQYEEQICIIYTITCIPKVICVRSLVPNEKKSAVLAICPAIKHARGISTSAPTYNDSSCILISPG